MLCEPDLQVNCYSNLVTLCLIWSSSIGLSMEALAMEEEFDDKMFSWWSHCMSTFFDTLLCLKMVVKLFVHLF